MPVSKRSFVWFVVLVSTACATAGGTGTRRDPNLISSLELTELGGEALTAFDAIQRLRPRWFTSRGSSVTNPADRLPAVVINSARQPMDILRSLRATEVESMRYLSPSDATTRYGTGYMGGVIEVVVRARDP